MRKDVKVVVAVACLVLIGLLAYVLFAPAEKAVEVSQTDDLVSPDQQLTADPETETESSPSIPTTPPVTVDLTPAPTTQPVPPPITVDIGGTTVGSTPASPVVTGPADLPPLPANTNVSSTNTAPAAPAPAAGPTDWMSTLNTGTVATASGSSSTSTTSAGGIPSNSLIGVSADPVRNAAASAATPAPTAAKVESSSASAAGSRTHKVVYGETLSSIAADYYGTRASYLKIAAANPSINPNRLKPGTTLVIPPLENGSATTAAGTTAPGTVSGDTYTVKSGDSLQRISARLYGTSEKWLKIYELNRATIGGDPHRLQAGMTIRLPEAPSTAASAR